VAALTIVAVAGCLRTAPSASPAPSGALPSTSASPVGTAPGLSPSSAPGASAPGAAQVDPALLDVLPAEIEGQPLRPDDQTAAGIEGLPTEVEAIAIGLYVQPGTSTADDLAIVSIVRLQPGVFDEAWFRSWRTTYDEGACQVAGGVAPGSAQTRIGEHETHIDSCVEGAHTYHVHLHSPDRVISITAVGERRFGERVVAGLTE
jgi:hypothetical protein